jgi:5-methylcytosine-specific restriction endonuclease McrA
MNVSISDRNKLRREAYAIRKANGLCTRCGNAPVEGGLECKTCADKQAEYIRQRRENRKSNSLCTECGKPVVDGKDLCSRHLAMRQDSILKINDKRMNRRKDGLCEQCGSASLERPGLDYKVCEICYLKNIAKGNLGDIKRWSSLKSLLELQTNICPYTGQLLVLGVNTTLDHKIPVSKGGDHSLSNLQWVYFDVYGGFDVNRMKGALTDQEYKEAIKKQASYLFSSSSWVCGA